MTNNYDPSRDRNEYYYDSYDESRPDLLGYLNPKERTRIIEQNFLHVLKTIEKLTGFSEKLTLLDYLFAESRNSDLISRHLGSVLREIYKFPERSLSFQVRSAGFHELLKNLNSRDDLLAFYDLVEIAKERGIFESHFLEIAHLISGIEEDELEVHYECIDEWDPADEWNTIVDETTNKQYDAFSFLLDLACLHLNQFQYN